MFLVIFIISFTSIVNLMQCEISNLSVRKMDQSLIERKRQDTRDICRIFTEENSKTTHSDPIIVSSFISPGNPHRRHKRETGQTNVKPPINPALKNEDIARVEKIVDKLYDDVEENGQKVTYMTNTPAATVTIKPPFNVSSNSSRRYFFAPSLLEGPNEKEVEYLSDHENTKVFESKARWKNGLIPYFVDPKSYDNQLAEVILKAFDYMEKVTCIRLQRLRERPTDVKSMSEVNWIYITNPTGIRQCVHSNEKRPLDGVQLIVFGYDCMTTGDIVHEVMHILGYSHEHSRSDRDQYITILWDNIKPGYKKYFSINKGEYNLENLPYDYASILHYPPRAFSRNGEATIISESGIKIGQRVGLSELDVEKVNFIYSGECVERNKEYLLKTCPSVVTHSKSDTLPKKISDDEIKNYFSKRLWSLGVVSYKLRDELEFSIDERKNIEAVMNHISKETCIQFSYNTDRKSQEIFSKEHSEDREVQNTDLDHEIDYTENAEEDNNEDKTTDPTITYPELHNDENENKDPDQNTNDNINYNEYENMNYKADGEIGDDQNPNDNIHNDEYDKVDSEIGGEHQSGFIDNLPKIIEADHNGSNYDVPENNDMNKETEDDVVTNDYNNDIYENEIGKEDSSKFRRKRIQIVPHKSSLKNRPQPLKTASGKHTTKRNSIRTYRGEKKKVSSKIHKKKTRKTKMSPSRRHASNILVLARSLEPGCKCPPPGKPEDNQVLYIGADCFNSVNDLLHLFVHVLGLDHQHNMHDRDAYLYINWKNLTSDIEHDLKQKLPPAASVGFPYDYHSVMHYPWLQIKNGVTNIMYPIWNDGWAMGHWQGLSTIDVQKLETLYYKECKLRDSDN